MYNKSFYLFAIMNSSVTTESKLCLIRVGRCTVSRLIQKQIASTLPNVSTLNETPTISLAGGDPMLRQPSNAVLVHIYFLWMAICLFGMVLSAWMIVVRRAHNGLVKLVMHAVTNSDDSSYA